MGKQTFLSPQTTNPQIFGLIFAIANQQISLLCQSANLQILMTNPQICKFVQNIDQLCFKTVLKVVFLCDFLLYADFN